MHKNFKLYVFLFRGVWISLRGKVTSVAGKSYFAT